MEGGEDIQADAQLVRNHTTFTQEPGPRPIAKGRRNRHPKVKVGTQSAEGTLEEQQKDNRVVMPQLLQGERVQEKSTKPDTVATG
jgi:hypothetical protein